MMPNEKTGNKQVHYLAFDMEKTLPIREINNELYLRQFWLYNIGVHYILHGNTEKAMFSLIFRQRMRLDAANINGDHLVA